MKSPALAAEAATARTGPVETRWPEPLTAAEWDERFPGVLDGVAFLSGAANVIMQLARPGVGYGVVESRVKSGNVFTNPAKRARTTFTFLSVAMLGTTEEKLLYRKAVNRSHAQVHSTASSPVKYHAFDSELQLWVAACLYWGLVDTMQKFRGELSEEEQAELLRLCETFGTTLQVRADMWPESPEAFERYWNAQLEKVHIDEKIRGFLHALVDLKMTAKPIRYTAGPILRFFTIGFLPQAYRDQMRFEWDETDQARFDRVVRAIGAVNRRLPRVVRQAPALVVMWDFRRRLREGLPLV